MDEPWTLSELVREVGARLDALPTPKNGQVRAVPDDRTIRYYGTIGLLDRPAMRGRTALYGRTHLAQVVAIKRLQTMGRSLAEIQTLWPTIDEATLSRMSGVALAMSNANRGGGDPDGLPGGAGRSPVGSMSNANRGGGDPDGLPGGAGRSPVESISPTQKPKPARAEFWKTAPVPASPHDVVADLPPPCAVELRVELAPNTYLTLVVDDGVAISPADVRAIRAVAAPLVAELERRLTPHRKGE